MTADAWLGFLDVPVLTPGPLVGTLRVVDTDLPVVPAGTPLRVVVSGGAGQVAGPVAWCESHGLVLTGVETSLRDPDDLAANARRVIAAAGAAPLPPDVRLHVAVPGTPTPAWLAAADEVAAVDGLLVLDLDDGDLEPHIDAALDRELPFVLSGGDADRAVAALTTTARLWGDADDLVGARRWCRSWACPDTAAAVAHLEELL